MSIYSIVQIDQNELYGDLMQGINKLYAKLGEPQELLDGAERATTGSEVQDVWDATEIGDWDGDEDYVADVANVWAEEVLAGIAQGYHFYHSSPKWDDFEAAAMELYYADVDSVFDRLCGLDICSVV